MGTRFRAVSHLMGRRIETVYEVNVFEPNKRYGFKSVSGPVDSDTLYIFEITEGGTRISLSTEIDPRDLFKPNDATAVKQSKKQYKENLAMLKSLLEAHRVLKT
jgi:hypothetical protein